MPEFRQASEIEEVESGDGWSLSLLADGTHVPGMPMAARRWSIDAGKSSPSRQAETGTESFLYVIAGGGTAEAGSESFPLATEDVVWLEPGETYTMTAGEAGLEVLEAAST